MRISISEDRTSLTERLRARAREAGFDVCRIARPDAAAPAGDRLHQWLASGAHGDMEWMATTAARRADPRTLWPDVRSVVMLAMNYGPAADPRLAQAVPTTGAISVYARGRDYHDLVKGRLKAVAGWLAHETNSQVKVFVDTAPVMEKPLAAAAGVGWQGKHTNLVSTDFGSWLFLGSIFTSLELDPDPSGEDRCGICRACLDACPTAAFPAPYQLDARRCISYLTIEHKGHIATALRKPIGNRIYGCDDCLAVCPWNKFAELGRQSKLQARDDLNAPALDELARLDDEGFRRMFAGGPVKRIGQARFLRNVLIAIGNSGNLGLAAVAAERLDHASPLVRAMAVWALSQLPARALALAAAAEHAERERDDAVRAEWDALRRNAATSIQVEE